ncbi:hypothetical protein OBBRIDRAFT_776007 [Obba rivulosa]|uniref:Actin cytoskeleton-regulatory complex protein SLA1 n=1 Tax=Obba rivulosa TaxID=1052685 RepID=A0A8E2DMF7_9APHY|nr:hypothetical protein OBBRIDRAFT_776007 [Obba rivulosa]
MAAEPETYLAVLKASYDYEPQPDAEEELAVKENQLLFLLERVDEDWWKVKIKMDSQEEDGASGLIPAAYVEPAEHISVVKALYDYEAQQSTELSVKEDEVLYVYSKDDDWLLVRGESDEDRVGYVPGNYVEEVSEEVGSAAVPESPPASTAPSISQIVVPSSPSRPVSVYVDPADRVAATKAQADDIKTWHVSEIDKKGKKKKGTLGIGNGAIFFASESDKTPVQKWQTSAVGSIKVEKHKHVYIEIGGAEPISLHYHTGSRDVAEGILSKLEASRALAGGSAAALSAAEEAPERPRSSAQKAVHFDAGEPEIIPPREPSIDGSEPQEDAVYEEPSLEESLHEEPIAEKGEAAVVLYDFAADGEDELSVQEGETLIVLERDGDEWWKCRSASGAEGVVPASYVELVAGSTTTAAAPIAAAVPDVDAAAAAKAALAKKRAESERQAKERERERTEKERAEKERERKKLEAEQRAKAAAAAAEAERKRREQEREKQREREKERERAAQEEASRKRRDSAEPSSSRPKKANGDSSSSTRVSIDRRGPPPENTRVWHDRTGQFRVEAAFLGYKDGKVRLHKINGVVIEVPSEKMSPEDMRYVDKLISKKVSPARKYSEDDEPLELRRQSLVPDAAKTPARITPSKKSNIDWFDFFLNAGCDVDDCTRYATSFERDKIDETILPDITESTMRSLGLREGDIIRVKKAIEQRQPKPAPNSDVLQDQLRRDEELARQLQAEEDDGRPRGQAPNLFAEANGALKNVRRGRPQPSKSLPPASVDLQSIAIASDQIQRTGSPQVLSPQKTTSPLEATPRSNSTAEVKSGFDDDAWTIRPSSTKPLAPTPPAVAPRAPSAPPAPPPPPAPPAPAQATAPAPASVPAPAPVLVAPPAPATPAAAPPAPVQPQATGAPLAKTDQDIFEQLARLSQLRTQSPALTQQASPATPLTSAQLARSPPPQVLSPPAGYQQGLGVGPSPVPIGQHLQAQQTGFFPLSHTASANGPRGPFAPVPANQSLLQPLVPTTTGFNSFVPTRPSTAPGYQSAPQQQSFLNPQPTGFAGTPQPLGPQPTGYPTSGPLLSQPTGIPNGSFGGGLGGSFGSSLGSGSYGSTPTPSYQPNTGFTPVQTNPTGFNTSFGQSPFTNASPFNNVVSTPPPAPPAPPAPAGPNTNPANVFAAMKSGNFANDNPSGPQSADQYNALRPNPSPLAAQPTGWGYQGMNGFQGGYGFHH